MQRLEAKKPGSTIDRCAELMDLGGITLNKLDADLFVRITDFATEYQFSGLHQRMIDKIFGQSRGVGCERHRVWKNVADRWINAVNRRRLVIERFIVMSFEGLNGRCKCTDIAGCHFPEFHISRVEMQRNCWGEDLDIRTTIPHGTCEGEVWTYRSVRSLLAYIIA